ncbi:hypothetical protein ACHAWO_008237 [Cyclotella atomus]|uniref:Uncharacterized protein n=1 Tax=Cyclotella atomus TaxID=382360 RepID=A0ABD3P1I0_9STRA
MNALSDDQLPDVHVLRRADNEGTAPTMFSAVSRSDRSSNRSLFRRDPTTTTTSMNKWSFLGFLKHGRRRKQLSEDQLRKQIKRHCENRDWSKVRKLISNHDFTEVPEVVLSSSSEGRQSQTMEPVHASRRPSYGSRNGDRLSFTGKESAAAAAVIKAAAAAALMELGSSSEDSSQKAKDVCDENILHDVCSHNPPRDVIELLLAAMRHRRGSTCGRDRHGRTPLHVAVATGASYVVIDALTRADPLAATMGDADQRSPLHLAVKYLAYDESLTEQNQHLATQHSSSKKPVFKSNATSANTNIMSKEEAIENTRRIVTILKNTMMTYPGQIDFKDEDSNGFAPLDYALDGSINDRTILRCLIRRDKSQDIRRKSSLQSESTDKTSKTRNALALKFTKQGSASTFGSKNSFQRTRRSSRSGSSFSSHDSMHSQDKELVHQIEKEEMEARRHRIHRLNSRKKTKKTKQMKSSLLDVFGIEEELASAQGQPDTELEQVEVQQEEQPDTGDGHLDDTPLKIHTRTRRSSFKSQLSFSMTTQGPIETTELTSKQTRHIDQQDTAAQQPSMTEEEMYNLHLQAYLADSMRNVIGDVEYCHDLDFLLQDPDEDELHSLSEQELETPVFEIILPICMNESAPQNDDCSEVTLRLLSITS